MKSNDKKYSQFSLCREMFESVGIIKNFDSRVSKKYIPLIQSKDGLYIIGEGSSRIFPAKHIISKNQIRSCGYDMFSECSLQAMEYKLYSFAIFANSKSGSKKELIYLLDFLNRQNHKALFGVTANKSAVLKSMVNEYTILKCGNEIALTSTKSIIEQALFFHSLYANLQDKKMYGLDKLSSLFLQ